MKKLELSQIRHDNSEKKIPLVENVLSKIREIEAREENQEINFIDVIDESLEEIWEDTENPVAKDYLKILEDHHQYDGSIEKFKQQAKAVQKQVSSLAELVSKRKPHLKTEEQLELVDQLYELNISREEFKRQDEIAALRILLATEEFKIESGDKLADAAYALKLRAEIAELERQL